MYGGYKTKGNGQQLKADTLILPSKPVDKTKLGL